MMQETETVTRIREATPKQEVTATRRTDPTSRCVFEHQTKCQSARRSGEPCDACPYTQVSLTSRLTRLFFQRVVGLASRIFSEEMWNRPRTR